MTPRWARSLISLGTGRIVSPVRIPRPLLVSVLAVPMIAVAHSAAADTTVQVDGTSATLTFTVASAAPYVQFYFDGKAVGMPVATSSRFDP